MIDLVKLKRYALTAFKVLILFELLSALAQGLAGKGWTRLGSDLLIAGVLYVMWGRIQNLLVRKRNEYRKMMEISGESVKLWDALVFSLLWTDEIYGGVPKDRSRLVVIAYMLIGLGLLASFVEVGIGLMPLIVSGALVLAAVNLLAWVVSAERGAKESLATELQLARDVQVSLMPKKDPLVDGFDISGRSLPALEVGGDHFAYRVDPAPGGRLGISVFDVSGKGLQAAMSAVFTTGAYSGEAMNGRSPAEILSGLNKAIYANTKRGQFVAFLLASLEPGQKNLRFANAGSVRPLLASDGNVRWLEGTGVNFPLGMVSDAAYQDSEVSLQSGDALLFLTDGFTEAMNSGMEQFGAERLEAVVGALDIRNRSASQLIDAITAEVHSHMAGHPQHDDMTMVVVKVL
jgi:sigma-B regulation protein RsbU (phosphoserine phosphatase)